MRAVRLLVLVGLTSVAAGCASMRGSSVSRLQSQMNLLDERVTQLERSSFGSSSASSGESASAWATPAEPAASPSITPAASSVKISSGTGVKPGTREVQQALKNAGFYQGAVDGKMGPVTRQAISEFQRVNGLTPDGVVGRQTWAKLSTYADLSGGGEATAGEPIK